MDSPEASQSSQDAYLYAKAKAYSNHKMESYISLARLGVLGLGFFVASYTSILALSQTTLQALFVLAIAYSLFVYFMGPTPETLMPGSSGERDAQSFAEISSVKRISLTILDGVMAFLFVACTGGVASPFYIVLFGLVLILAFRHSLVVTLAGTAIVALLYGSLAANETPQSLWSPEFWIRIGFLLLAGIFGALLVKALRQQGAFLIFSNANLREQLRSQNQSLEDQKFLLQTGHSLTPLLTLDQVAARIAHTGIPYLADFCVVDLYNKEHNLDQLYVAHSEPQKEFNLESARQSHWSLLRDLKCVKQARSSGEPVFIKDLKIHEIVDVAEHPEAKKVLGGLSPRSCMSLPLHTESESLGVISFFYVSSALKEPSRIQELSERFAEWAALTIHNSIMAREMTEQASITDEELAKISHQLRANLNVIMGFAELLNFEEDFTENQKQSLEAIQRSAQAQLETLNGLIERRGVQQPAETQTQ